MDLYTALMVILISMAVFVGICFTLSANSRERIFVLFRENVLTIGKGRGQLLVSREVLQTPNKFSPRCWILGHEWSTLRVVQKRHVRQTYRVSVCTICGKTEEETVAWFGKT